MFLLLIDNDDDDDNNNNNNNDNNRVCYCGLDTFVCMFICEIFYRDIHLWPVS
jgi:hypothetical protein